MYRICNVTTALFVIGQKFVIFEKNPIKPEKTRKSPKKPEKARKNPTQWVFSEKPGFFQTLYTRRRIKPVEPQYAKSNTKA